MTAPEDTAPATTHAEWGAGNPRLIVSRAGDHSTVSLGEETLVGSAPTADVVVDGAESSHATVTHRDDDEYVVTLHGAGELTANPDTADFGTGADAQVLRHGARFVIGDATFVFQRDEYADHGRPAGGRQGGELADQASQPARPDYAAGEGPRDAARGGAENVEDPDQNVV